ncbi:MAG: single-stranded-DNA-specific exonuclease RecJ [Chloroflexi bacterium HGW-Chloroflexi-6]|nr:MAG: single-stranded-DNA-specific exonuclease RecJ [Chloroflexi bacterium HGW-Chloroflexi-6]
MLTWLDPAPVNAQSLDELGIHPIVSRALTRRGFDSAGAARAFLEPGLYPVTPASELPDIEPALRRIWKALRQNERICVWGDFDVDGQTATTVLIQTLRAIGANVTYHIPIREKESHGVKIEYLKTEIDSGAQLILTCDTGISEHKAVEYANSRGVDVLITDHHDLPEGPLPSALAVINPKRLPESHPLATLAGVGVAYKLAEALLQNANTDLAPESLRDLAALGLVADVATLSGDTRYLVQRGLEQLRRNQRLGLQVMLELAGTNPLQLTETHIGFTLGPRLNAIGRLGDANPVVELLTTNDPAKARVLAAQLEGLNQERQLLTSQVTQAAQAQLRENPALLEQAALVLHHPDWPAGIIGIAASRLAERYQRPTLLLTGRDPVRGSARSVDGVHITEAIRACGQLLLGFGGHPMAAGLSLPAENLISLRRELSRAVESQLKTAARPPAELQIDEFLSLDELTLDLAAQIEQMAPFGAGNPPLLLATRNLELAASQKIGKTGEHIKLTVRDETGNVASALWWGGAEEEQPSGRFDLAYTLRASDFKGQKQLALELVDFRIVAKKPIEIESPKIETIDLRAAEKRTEALQRIQAEYPDALLFAEGNDRKRLNGKGRHELSEAETLILWTTPPERRLYESILETVKPRRLVLFAQDSGENSPEAFLARLAGVLKFVLNQREGRVSLAELGAACGQGEAAIRSGFEYLKASGQLAGESDAAGLTIRQANAPADEPARAQYLSQLTVLLNESQAYRSFFRGQKV